MDNSSQVKIIRGLCGVFVLISVMIALNPNNLITSLMSLSWGTLSGCFLGPFVWGLFWKKSTKMGAWASLVTGLGINMANFFTGYTTSIHAGAVSMIVSLLIVPAVSLITPKLPKQFVEEAFSCYDAEVMVAHKMALTEDEDR